MKWSAVILAGGFSKRFGRNKGLIELAGKPLILHVLKRTANVVDEVVVAVSSDAQRRLFASLLPDKVNVAIDGRERQSPLVGAAAGFENAQGECSMLLPCDTPFVSDRVVQLLQDQCINRNAVIPRWPNGYIEPFQAAYRTESALRAAESALKENKFDMRSMVLHMRHVRYVSTLVLLQIDPDLSTLFNVNTPEDLKRAESICSSRNPRVR